MFSFVSVVLLVAIIAHTQALECYQGEANANQPVTKQTCPPETKYCYTIKHLGSRYGCDDVGLCKGCTIERRARTCCRTISEDPFFVRTVCCCASDRCNRG
ncbi:unnamed protein product [Cylicocyclus nassatus]|uniref:Uncharacterized protein n=1 Tax=Cylicocyclus nassatus TaxID=53992 RepID=A0AA36GTU1_CYLNA|nr:unnamed protein product [Cylicocyclus nassatus]